MIENVILDFSVRVRKENEYKIFLLKITQNGLILYNLFIHILHKDCVHSIDTTVIVCRLLKTCSQYTVLQNNLMMSERK